MQTEPPQSVFILKPSSFGDIIHTLPAVAWLKSAWPAARLTWLVNPEWAPLLEGNPDLHGVVTFPRREFRGWRGPARFLRWQRQHVRPLRPDLVLDFQGLLRSALIGRFSAPCAMFGLADAREGSRWLYDRTAPIPAGIPHSVERYLALTRFALRQTNPSGLPPLELPVRFPLPPGRPLAANDAASLHDGYVLLHPFSRGRGKSLSPSQVGEFCRQLAPRQVVLVGKRNEDAGVLPVNALDLLDRTSLPQLLWTLRRAAFVISVDSGPAHLAAALGCPMVAIHTWSDPRRVGPYRPDAWVWKSGRLLRVRDLSAMPTAFFDAPPSELSPPEIGAICALATSPSDFSA